MLAQFRRLFQRAEKYLATDLRYIMAGGFWMTAAKVVSGASSFITSLVFANLIPKEIYGLYRFVLSYLSVLTLPTLAGIDTSLTKAVGQGYRGSIVPALKEKIKWGLLAGVASLTMAVYYFWQQNISLALCFALAAIFLPFMDPFQLFLSYLNGKRDYATYTKYHTVLKSIVTVLIVATLFLTHDLVLIILSYLASYTLLRLVFLVLTVSKNGGDNTNDPSIISYGKHLSLMSVLGTVAIALDKILVFHFVGAAALASYYLAMVPYKQVQNFVSSLNSLALPKFASNTEAGLRATLPRKVIKSYAIIIPIILAYAIVAPTAFRLFYPQYVEVIWLSVIFMAQLIFFPIYLFNTALVALGKKRELYVLSVSYAIVKILLLLILVPLWGMPGAVTAVITTIAFGALSNLWIFMRKPQA